MITYNYCSTNFVARNYPFYRVDAETFEDLATTVLSEKYKIPFLKFKSGNDAGQDAVAKRVNIDLGGKNILTDQNVVVQVKHTRYETKSFSDKTRKRVFDGGKKKVEKLVNENELDIYIIVTNYELPAGQCKKLEETFKNCGAKQVHVVGNETLTQWLNDSQELQQKVLRLYFSSPSTSSDYLDVAMDDDDITGLSMALSLWTIMALSLLWGLDLLLVLGAIYRFFTAIGAQTFFLIRGPKFLMPALPVSSNLLIVTVRYGKYNCSFTKVLSASAVGIKMDKNISVVLTELLIFQTFSTTASSNPTWFGSCHIR